MSTIKHQFKQLLNEVEKTLFRLIAGLSVEDDRKLTKICEICEVEKYKVIMWRDHQKIKLNWTDILYFTYRYERLPYDKEVALIAQYGIDLYIRLKRLNKIPA